MQWVNVCISLYQLDTKIEYLSRMSQQSVEIAYSGGTRVRLRVGDDQTEYKGPRGVGASVSINGVSGYTVANWGPNYLSFHRRTRTGRDYMVIHYSSRAFTPPPRAGKDWGNITSIDFGTIGQGRMKGPPSRRED